MNLTAIQCQSAKQKNKTYRLTDGGGLYLEVASTGRKYWRWQYHFGGKRPRLAFGVFPEVSLKEARERRDHYRKLLRDGIDPAVQRKRDKLRSVSLQRATFETIAREWHQTMLDRWAPDTARKILHRLEKDVFPVIGEMPISDLRAPDVLIAIRKIEARGATFLSALALQYVGRVFRYAIATGRTDNDPTYRLSEALKPHQSDHLAAIEIEELPEFMTKLRSNRARLFRNTVIATELLLLTFVRTSELIAATWDEVDIEQRRWLIPASRMKMRKDHIIPLSTQATKLFSELQDYADGSLFVFPHQKQPDRHMSNNTVLEAIRRLGYHGRMTGHGFRALAMSTIKEKLHYRHEVIDRQLAHQPRSRVDKAYDRAQFIEQRTQMMQDWADYIDDCCRKALLGDS